MHEVDEKECLIQPAIEQLGLGAILGHGLKGVGSGFPLSVFPHFSCRSGGVPQMVEPEWHQYQFPPQHPIRGEAVPEFHCCFIVVILLSRRTRYRWRCLFQHQVVPPWLCPIARVWYERGQHKWGRPCWVHLVGGVQVRAQG